MKKKIISLTLALLLVLTAVPFSPFSAAAVTRITKVDITGIATPMAGERIDLYSTGDDPAADAGWEVQSVEWSLYDAETGDETPFFPGEEDYFVAGQEYFLRVLVVIPAGDREHLFAVENNGTEIATKCTINGEEADAESSLSCSPETGFYVVKSYECPEAQVIDTVAIDKVIEPLAGKLARHDAAVAYIYGDGYMDTQHCHIDTSYNEDTIIDGKKYVFEDGVAWMRVNDGVYLSSADDFVKDEPYRLQVRLVPDDGYVFAVNGRQSAVTATVNDGDASASAVLDHLAKDYIMVERVFYAETPVTTIDLSITAPQEGATPSTLVGKKGSGYIVNMNERYWFDNTTGRYLGQNDKFIAGHAYSIQVQVDTLSGYQLDYEFDADDNMVCTAAVSVNNEKYDRSNPNSRVYVDLISGDKPTSATITYQCGTVKSTKVDINNVKVSGYKTSFTYNGKPQKQNITLTYGGKKLVENTDYTLTYFNYKNAGTAEMTVTGIGKYTGSVTLKYKINPKKVTPKVKLSKTSYVYDSTKTRKPSVTVTADGKNMTEGTHYTVSYAKGRMSVGKYAVKVTMKGNYSGSATEYFYIYPQATKVTRVTSGKGSLTIYCQKIKEQVQGYEFQVATDKKFTKNKKTATTDSYKTYSKQIKNLKKGTKYYIRVRTYKTVNKVKYYSSWSTVTTAKTKK